MCITIHCTYIHTTITDLLLNNYAIYDLFSSYYNDIVNVYILLEIYLLVEVDYEFIYDLTSKKKT